MSQVAQYPKWIAAPTPTQADRRIKVEDAQEHLAANPADYELLQKQLEMEAKSQGAALAHSPAAERERCAQVAENHEKSGDIGKAIAAAIRSTGSEVSIYPKVLRSPACQLVGDGKFTVANPNGTFSRPDATVNNPAEEAAARADGFTVVAPEPAAEPVKTYPKALRNPETVSLPTVKFTVKCENGKYARPDVIVHDAAEEAAAKADGFSIDAPIPVVA